MKYAIFFGTIFLYLTWVVFSGPTPESLIVIWPAVNALIYAIAYSTNNPRLICGKTNTGEINPLLALINLPWLALSLVIWKIETLISRENYIDRIGSSNWYISSYPGYSYPTNEYDYVIDLTAEFPRARNARGRYICFPNLDGIELTNMPTDTLFAQDDKILVHCAQGHDRSATWSSFGLSSQEIFDSPESAYREILSSRPGATVSRYQLQQLKKANKSI